MGKIIVAGLADIGVVQKIALARYNSDGTLDTSSFGAGTGIVTTSIGSGEAAATGVVLQTDGKIVVGGYAFLGGLFQFALARYNPDGTLDTSSFGAGTGIVVTPITSDNNAGLGVALQFNGKIVVAGYAVIGSNTQFALSRYNTDGTLDNTFNPSGAQPGIVMTQFDSSSNSLAFAVTLQTDGKIVAAGSTNIGGITQFALARYISTVPQPPFIQSTLAKAIKQKYCPLSTFI